MEPIRIRDLKVGKLYRWHLGDPQELFIVLGVPPSIDPIHSNIVEVLSNRFSKRTMHVFTSDKFFEVQ